jgi:hypothetical protein
MSRMYRLNINSAKRSTVRSLPSPAPDATVKVRIERSWRELGAREGLEDIRACAEGKHRWHLPRFRNEQKRTRHDNDTSSNKLDRFRLRDDAKCSSGRHKPFRNMIKTDDVKTNGQLPHATYFARHTLERTTSCNRITAGSH